MIRLTLNLALRPWYSRKQFTRIVVAAAVVLLLVAGIGINRFFRVQQELQRMNMEISRFDKELTDRGGGVSQQTLAQHWKQVTAVNTVLVQHNRQHWLQIFDTLEKVMPEGVYLVRLAPDSKGEGLTLHGRASSFAELQRLLEKLLTAGIFKEPVLVSHAEAYSQDQIKKQLQFVVAVKVVSP